MSKSPLPLPAGIQLAELISALSHALDITEGQPQGHCVRCCWIGMHIAQALGLSDQQRWELYYTLLLKDLGCSSNAARICELYLTDDLAFKRDFKRVGDGLAQVARFVLQHTGLKAGLAERFRSVLNVLREGPDMAQELSQTRCQRGAAADADQARVGQRVPKQALHQRPGQRRPSARGHGQQQAGQANVEEHQLCRCVGPAAHQHLQQLIH